MHKSNWQVITGDCRDVLATYPDNSFDAVICDPPYEIGFMSKGWDNSGIAYDVDMWRQVLRVLKPGAHLLCFGGTRTYHRIAVAIEDAGFQIRDCLAYLWMYGSGFPKSLDVGKAIDREAGASIHHGTAFTVAGVGDRKKMQTTAPSKGYVPPEPKTPEAKQWAGYGTGLKPAFEPIVLARKPIESGLTIAGNVLKYGTGAINIDGCRVFSEDVNHERERHGGGIKQNHSSFYFSDSRESMPPGRWPANLIHDGSDAVEGLFPDVGGGKEKTVTRERNKGWCNASPGNGVDAIDSYGDTGSASRFFYVAKPSQHERNAGLNGTHQTVGDGRKTPIDNPFQRGKTERRNIHPTVKPVTLLEYLARLICPPGGTILDPFCGSGSMGMASISEGFDYVGIELSQEYAEIARARIFQARRGQAVQTKEQQDLSAAGQMEMF